MFEVPHPAGAGRLTALCLLSPLVGAQFRAGVPALRTLLVLLVERTIAAAATECMRLGVALAEG